MDIIGKYSKLLSESKFIPNLSYLNVNFLVPEHLLLDVSSLK